MVDHNTPTLSVITICLNAQQTIRRTIESVLSQSYPNIEYIIIDGASTDATLSIIREYEGRLRLISEPDTGYSDAVNKGIAQASGEWIHLLNADDYYPSPHTLSDIIPLLDKNRLNYCSIVRTWKEGGYKTLPLRYEARWPFKNKKWFFWISTSMLHPAMIISNAQYEQVGKYNTEWKFSADIDMILRLFKHYRTHYIGQVLVHMQQGGMAQHHRHSTASEFAHITVRHGLPRVLAWSIYAFKLWVLWPAFMFSDRFRSKTPPL
jgi:glycosyltransferase involved in cell wall biosynthesis